jgi:hypothetical protein
MSYGNITPTLLPQHALILKSQTIDNSPALIYWTLLRWANNDEAQGSLSYEVCACLEVQEASENTSPKYSGH